MPRTHALISPVPRGLGLVASGATGRVGHLRSIMDVAVFGLRIVPRREVL